MKSQLQSLTEVCSSSDPQFKDRSAALAFINNLAWQIRNPELSLQFPVDNSRDLLPMVQPLVAQGIETKGLDLVCCPKHRDVKLD